MLAWPILPLLWMGCSAPPADDWRDQLVPSGACWSVDLSDGLDEQSTAELHDLYGCLNRSGDFTPLGGLVDAMDTTGRGGVPLGIELARLVNHLPDADIDVFGLAGYAVDLLREDAALVRESLAVVVELLYGQPYVQIQADGPASSESALDRGVVRPILPVLARAAGVLLDEGPALTDGLADALDSETLYDGLCLLVGINASADPATAALSDDLLPDLGRAIAQARSPGNDLWSGASGDSLRDLVDAFFIDEAADSQNLLQALQPDLETILTDAALGRDLADALADAEAGRHLDPLPTQLLYLASVDVDGGSLSAGELSALASLLRMLHTADAPLQCSVRVLGLSLVDIRVDNLSVEILQTLAQQEPETIDDALNLLGGALGWGLTQSVLDLIVDSEVCPLLSDQLIGDLDAINRLADPEAADLLVVMLDLLQVFSARGTEPVDALVGVLSLTHARGAVPPVEEALRDLASSALVDDLTDLLPLLLDPSDLPTDTCPTGAVPLDFDAAWALLADASASTSDGTGDDLKPLLLAVLNHEGTWTAAGNLGTLLAEDQAELQGLADLMGRAIALDPDLSLLRDSAALLADPTLVQPALKIAEDDTVSEALGRAELTAEGPLPFVARLIVGGTLESVLRTVDLLLGLLETPEEG